MKSQQNILPMLLALSLVCLGSTRALATNGTVSEEIMQEVSLEQSFEEVVADAKLEEIDTADLDPAFVHYQAINDLSNLQEDFSFAAVKMHKEHKARLGKGAPQALLLSGSNLGRKDCLVYRNFARAISEVNNPYSMHLNLIIEYPESPQNGPQASLALDEENYEFRVNSLEQEKIAGASRERSVWKIEASQKQRHRSLARPQFGQYQLSRAYLELEVENLQVRALFLRLIMKDARGKSLERTAVCRATEPRPQ